MTLSIIQKDMISMQLVFKSAKEELVRRLYIVVKGSGKRSYFKHFTLKRESI